jgi:pyruvate kinase
MKRAKIVCTIGPASRDEETLDELVAAGMDVVRLNMSHGTTQGHAEVIERVRRVARARGKPVAILLDLSGPKIRLRELEVPVDLAVGEKVTLTCEDVVGRGRVLPVGYAALMEELAVGHSLSLADGAVLLEVESLGSRTAEARVLTAGRVSSHKGVALPGGATKLPALTEKDERDLRFGLSQEVDWVAMSFVRRPEDVERTRELMREVGCTRPILAKIEKTQALDAIEEIVEAFDGLMVARGDLGVEIPLPRVPEIQKDLIRRANLAAKPVITATQMLLSMVSSPRPTRAEVTDVANAILDGTDAVMLSDESAVGEHPVGAVTMMSEIAERAEGMRQQLAPAQSIGKGVPAAIARATFSVAEEVGARLVVTPTTSGSTARLVAVTRPPIPILALSPEPTTVAQLALTWGVTGRLIESPPSVDGMLETCRREARASGLVGDGDRVVVTMGLPLDVAGTTNLLEVLEV